MSVIILKGTDKKLECSIALCEKINKMKEDGVSPKTPLNISGTVVELGEIRYAIKDGETDRQLNSQDKSVANDTYLKDLMSSFDAEVDRYANSKLEDKLQFNLRVARFYCYAITGGEIEEYKPELKTIFIEELKKEKLVVNPVKYIKLFKVKEEEGREGLTRIQYIVRKAPLKIMENYLQNVYFRLNPENR